MRLAIEQAGSVFTGWIASCLSCLRPEGEVQSSLHQHAMKSKGVERQMRICHTQPHLVPPMKLVVYDDLPSPGPPPRTSSFPSWIAEGRSIASRASNRASMSFKRQSTTPLRISAPTDFRRVETFQSFASSPAEFQPLVLRIHTPGNRLSDLPTFDDFPSQEGARRSLAWPAKALVSATDPSRLSRGGSYHHHSSSSFQLPRKPVGSASRRSSLPMLEQLLDKQSPVTSPVIPHFSARASTATSISEALFSPTLTRLESSAGYGSMPPRQRSDINSFAVPPKTPPKTPLQDRPLPALPTDNTPSSTGTSTSNPSPSIVSENDFPSPTPTPNTTPSRTGRVAQWLLQTGNKAFTPASPPTLWKPRTEKSASASAFRIRSRTLSGSTAVSSAASTTTSTGLGPRTPPSRGTLNLPSEKDLETFPSRTLFSSVPPAISSASLSMSKSIPDDRPHPTIYEGQQQQFAHSELDYYTSPGHRQSTIGLAF